MQTTDRTGQAAIGAGLLMSASITAELVHDVQAADGTVLDRGLWGVYLSAFVVGAALLVRATAGVGGPSRAARVGRRLNVAGAALILLSGLLLLPTGLLTGTPLEAAFVPFAIGLLLSAAGALTLGTATRSVPLLLVGAGALVAVLLQPPAHDVGMLVFLLGWAAIGVLRMRGAARPVDVRV